MNAIQKYLEIEKHCKKCPYISSFGRHCKYISYDSSYQIYGLPLTDAIAKCKIVKLRNTISKRNLKT